MTFQGTVVTAVKVFNTEVSYMGIWISSYYLGRLTHSQTVREKESLWSSQNQLGRRGEAQTARIRKKSFIPLITQKFFKNGECIVPDNECDWE